MSIAEHPYPFDPTYGYSLDDLLAVGAPEESPEFAPFWRNAYERALAVSPRARFTETGQVQNGWRVYDVEYTSTGETAIGGWLLVPASGPVRRGMVIGHGYGGREEPDFDCPVREAALLFPCCRGQGRSVHPDIPSDSQKHVLHAIEQPEQYVIRGCVEDIWVAVTVLLNLFPQFEGRVGYIGGSFGGGVGALALAWDKRVRRAHLCVPTFGNHPLRLTLPNTGSGAAVNGYNEHSPEVLARTLPFYDAAVAARHIDVPVHCTCALFDPSVVPPGQFAVYNALGGPKALHVIKAGHFEHPGQAEQDAEERRQTGEFFTDL